MFVWRKRAGIVWLAANEATLREVAGRRLAIISRPGRKNAIAEIAGSNRPDLESIRSRFGGIIEKLPRDWLTRFSRAQTTKPIRIGKRLVVTRSGGFQTAVGDLEIALPCFLSRARARLSGQRPDRVDTAAHRRCRNHLHARLAVVATL